MPKIFLVLVLLIVIADSSLAADLRPLDQVVLKKGAVIYLKKEHVPAHYSDGTPTYLRTLISHVRQRTLENDPRRILGPLRSLDCIIDYSTSSLTEGYSLPLIPGRDVNMSVGATAPWVVDRSLDPIRYKSEINSNGFHVEYIHLNFYGSALQSISCSIARPPEDKRPLAVQDFVDANRGVMSLLEYP